jgi:tetratricopeptide (TPR) repeat protein
MNDLDELKARLSHVMKGGEYKEAVQLTHKILAHTPLDTQILLTQGLAHYQLNEWGDALKVLSLVITHDPNNSDALFMRGSAFLRLQDYVQALNDFNQAIVIQPTEALFTRRAMVFTVSGQLLLAIQDYTQAIALNPSNGALYHSRSTLHYHHGELQSALEDMNQAIALGINTPQAFTHRGSYHAQLKQYLQALADFNQALSLDLRYAEAFYNRGAVSYQQGDIQGALTDFSKAIKIEANTPSYYEARAKAYAQRGRKEDLVNARRDWNVVMQLDSENASAYLYRALVYYRLNKLDRAEADLWTLINHTQVTYVEQFKGAAWLLVVMVLQDKLQEAQATFSELESLLPQLNSVEAVCKHLNFTDTETQAYHQAAQE